MARQQFVSVQTRTFPAQRGQHEGLSFVNTKRMKKSFSADGEIPQLDGLVVAARDDNEVIKC